MSETDTEAALAEQPSGNGAGPETPGDEGGETPASEPEGLLGKLYRAQEAVGGSVERRGRNAAQNYDFAQAVDVIRVARRALLAVGLVAVFRPRKSTPQEVLSTNNTPGRLVDLEGSLLISDPETKESMEVPGFGSGIDYPGDKAVFKAYTGAKKYAHAAALDLAFGEDPEEATEEEWRLAAAARAADRDAERRDVGADDGAAPAPSGQAARAGGMRAVSRGPASDAGAAPASPAARKRLGSVMKETGLEAETLKAISSFLYGEVHSDRLTEAQAEDFGQVLETYRAAGIAPSVLKGQLTRGEAREDRAAARIRFSAWLLERARKAEAGADTGASS